MDESAADLVGHDFTTADVVGATADQVAFV